MDERTEEMNDIDDMDFAELFSSLDSVKASDDLKTATLDAIFAGVGNDPTPEDKSSKTNVVKLPHKSSRGKKNSTRLRIAGIAACVALAGTIGTAYTMPRSYASIDSGDTNLTLGINALGMTVSAESDSEQGKKLIADSDLVNKDYRESIGTVATNIATHSEQPETTVELSVSSDNDSQRASVKRGSSEALEISGYKKKTSSAKSVDAAENKAKSAAEASEEKADSAEADDATGEIDDSNSFVIDTEDAKEEQESSKASNSVDTSSKYHPLADDKASSTSATESDTAASSEAADSEDSDASGSESQAQESESTD